MLPDKFSGPLGVLIAALFEFFYQSLNKKSVYKKPHMILKDLLANLI